ncbi:hypothetical protein BDW69DRAFT_178420 [Aspergillus filifer]
MVQQFMVRGQHGPVEVLLDWRMFGLKIHYNTTAPGHVTWMGQERLLYKERDFTMGQFRGFVHGVVGAARELMTGLLCQPDRGQWPAIPWDRLFDNPAEGTPGWSFLQDRRTPWPVAGGPGWWTGWPGHSSPRGPSAPTSSGSTSSRWPGSRRSWRWPCTLPAARPRGPRSC